MDSAIFSIVNSVEYAWQLANDRAFPFGTPVPPSSSLAKL